jgi:hypothetical protein
MILHVISYVISCREQDCVVVLAPYPNNPNPVESFNVKTDFDLMGNGLVRYTRPQLFFNCNLCPTGDKGSAHSGLHKEVSLVYFSTFEPPIDLTADSIMQRAGVPMLYDSASNPRLPCLYICPVANVLGRAPLIPCFIGGNSHPIIPYRFKDSDDLRFGHASADTGQQHCYGSRLYELNIWMWRYGRGRPRMVSIAEAGRIRVERLSESRIRAAETRKRRSEAAAAAGAAQGGGGAD